MSRGPWNCEALAELKALMFCKVSGVVEVLDWETCKLLEFSCVSKFSKVCEMPWGVEGPWGP